MQKSYRTVTTFRDMTQFGINPLTGESCAFSMRMLCDVNEAGKALVSEFFGIPNLALEKNWNSVVDNEPAIGSLMLTHDIVPKLAQFAFFRAGALAVVTTTRDVIGVFEGDLLKNYETLVNDSPNSGYAIRRNPAAYRKEGIVGSRNVHQFTGRAV